MPRAVHDAGPHVFRPHVDINGKFLSAGPTAVHRVAKELVTALAALKDAPEMRILVPPGIGRPRNDPGLDVTATGRFRGIAWEQISLPMARRRGLLLNLCNMTPLLARHALTLVHDAQVFTTPVSFGHARSAWARLHSRAAGRLQPRLLTVSEFARSELAAFGIAEAERIDIIPNGVDHVLRTPPDDAVLARLGLRPRGFALSLANTQAHKNIGVLLRAFSRPALAEMPLVLVGRARPEAFEAAGTAVPPGAIFAGYVSDGEMRSLLAQALAFCSPSLTEGFGMPPVEAMILGTPAVIAPRGALPEVCGPGALHADPHDPAAWEAALLRFRDDPDLWRATASAGLAHAARFTWAAAARRLADVICRLEGEKEGHRGRAGA